MGSRYNDLTREELIRLLEARDRREATRFGLVWEANEIERDKALNSDFVALDLVSELSAGTAPWRNLIIEGDNFDALRYLRMAFAGRVKCIYIDPPYNTGNRDFVYNDRFVDREDLWRHSKWCEFMFQRLTLARDLLAPDGAIFVSVDDNEVFSLGLMMNRVFGEGGFVANCIWQKRYSRENREAIGDAHDFLIVYSPRPDLFKVRRGLIPLTEKQRARYKNPNNDPRGPWQSVSLTAQGYRPNQMYEIVAPGGKRHRPPEGACWKLIEPEYQKLVTDGRVYFGKEGNGVPRRMYFLSEAEGLVPWTWWPHDEVGHTDEARKEIQALFGTQTAFETPKPVRLIERVLRIASGCDDLILDFFAGSGTTAHAVHKLNAQDGGRRRCILVSNTEATVAEPDKNLCRDVCAERVRRVIQGYTSRDGEQVPGLGGDFAYLRYRRIPQGRLLELDHAEIWTALQLIHREVLMPYAEAPLLWAGDDEQGLLYVPRFRREDAAALRAQANQSAAVILYSWQPETLRQHVPAPHVQHEAIPESLARRFGLIA
ncbi:MAG TPA: site-specific DNA-methyltransferase [Verrucomicrobiota bacterium]|nr:site-specific DNA-methyltransferase [Verrucomicrobiota bacterium]